MYHPLEAAVKTALRVAFWLFPPTLVWSGVGVVVAPKTLKKHCKLYRFMWTGSTKKAD